MSAAALGTAALVAGAAQTAIGLGQSIFSGRRKAEDKLNQLASQSPLAKESTSINDYYQQAMNRAKQNQYQSQQYQVGAMNARQATAQGLNALQDRRSGIGGASKLALGQNMALNNLGVQAENQTRANFGQYGQAAQAKQADLNRVFQINQEDPYLRRFGLAQYNAQAANARQQAGLQTAAGGLSNIASSGMGGIKSKSKGANGLGEINASNYAPSQSWLTRTNYFSDPNNQTLQYP